MSPSKDYDATKPAGETDAGLRPGIPLPKVGDVVLFQSVGRADGGNDSNGKAAIITAKHPTKDLVCRLFVIGTDRVVFSGWSEFEPSGSNSGSWRYRA